MGLLMTLRPQWWFSAHLHVRFEATVVHENNQFMEQPTSQLALGQNPDEIAIEDDDDKLENDKGQPPVENVSRNPDEIALDDEEENVISPPPLPPPPIETKFLALDKCLPRRAFLEVSTHKRPFFWLMCSNSGDSGN